MFDAFKPMSEVHTMADVRARAEYLAWMTHEAYRDAGRHAPELARADRAASFWKARGYFRRAVRASQYANRHA